MRVDTNDYLRLFVDDVPMIDSRAPIEFQHGAFPNTVNLPLMVDHERALVGTCYKEQGQDAAIRLGHQLVNGDVKAQRVQSWVNFAQQNPSGYLYCFRGGVRSQICQQWMREAGCDYPRIIGGYKAMRRFLLEQLDMLCQTHPLLILAGHTGAAKTELLQKMPGAVDLEAIANHRGSAFGKKPDGQPSQIDFENRVIIAMIKLCHRAPDRPIILEDESRLIGRCALPPVLRDAMAKAPVLLLDTDAEDRVNHSWQNYILRKSEEWQAEVGHQHAFASFSEDLRDSLSKIRKRLGGDRYVEVSELLESALLAHEQGDPTLHKGWIRKLLSDYYDPMYEWQWQKHHARVVYRGAANDILAYAGDWRPDSNKQGRD